MIPLHQLKSNSRRVIHHLLKEKYFCGLDIGAQSVKASLVQPREDGTLALLGVYETRTNGFKHASISDLGELSETVHAAIAGLTGRAGVRLKEVELGIGGELIASRFSSAVSPLLERGSKVISHRDVKRIQNQAKLLGAQMDEVVLHDVAQFYRIDDANIALNPVGLYGRKLEMKMLLVIVSNMVLKNLVKAVNQAGYDVAHVFFTSFSAAEAVLRPEQKQEGCIFIDVGSMMTDVLVFCDGQLRYVQNIPVGGEHVTQCLAEDLALPFDLAEDIKQSYASAADAHMNLEEEILIKRNSGYVPVCLKNIRESIEPLIHQLVEDVKTAIRKSGYRDQMLEGVVMTGGGSLLPGFLERIERSTELSVRIGQVNITDKRLLYGTKFAGAVGLAQTGFRRTLRRSLAISETPGWPVRVAHKFRELYQEYF